MFVGINKFLKDLFLVHSFSLPEMLRFRLETSLWLKNGFFAGQGLLGRSKIFITMGRIVEACLVPDKVGNWKLRLGLS